MRSSDFRKVSYIPQDVIKSFRPQAIRVWAFTLTAVLLWVGIIVAAPLMANDEMTSFSGPIYRFFSFICHQMPERSFHLGSHQMAVCSRCFGVYFGLLLGIAIYPLWRRIENIEPLARIWLILSIVPITIDWSLTVLGIWENTHLSRFLTGSILGIACGTFIMPGLIEIIRNTTLLRGVRQT